MTYAEAHYMRDDPHLLAKRLSAFVRSRASAKQLAERIDCDVRTAENIRREHWPIARHWLGLVAAFGEDLTEAVFHPDRAIARLEKEVADLEVQVAAKRAELRDLQGLHPGGPQAPSRHEDGAAEVGEPDRSFEPRRKRT